MYVNIYNCTEKLNIKYLEAKFGYHSTVVFSLMCTNVMLTHFLGRPRGLFSFGGSFEKEIGKGIKHLQTAHFTDSIFLE